MKLEILNKSPIFLCKFFSFLIINLLVGCVTSVKTSSENLAADIKWTNNYDVAMTFPMWISEDEKIQQLKNEAKSKAASKCKDTEFELIEVLSKPYKGSIVSSKELQVSSIAANIRCGGLKIKKQQDKNIAQNSSAINSSQLTLNLNSDQAPENNPKAFAPRQPKPTRENFAIDASTSQLDNNGIATISIRTGIDTSSLKLNGEEEGGRADGNYSVKRFVQIGENKFDISVTDRFGNTQLKEIYVHRKAVESSAQFATLNPSVIKIRPSKDAVAIIIGIQDYRRVPKADFANNDARAFYDYAIRGLGVSPENIKILIDQQADDIEILGAFKNWLPLKSKNSLTDVYVFFSGHGYPSDDGESLYLLPHGVDRQFLDRSAIKQSDIIQALQAVSPKSVTLFIDACYSGQSRGGDALIVGARPIAIKARASVFPSNFTVMAASAPDQIASSSPAIKHGIFSYYLMKGMEGDADTNKDGQVSIGEMQGYLKDNVSRLAMAQNRNQQPQFVGDGNKILVAR
jgi:hypothetical protein